MFTTGHRVLSIPFTQATNMTRQQFLRLLRESKPLLRTATPAQKVKLLQLIRESYRKLNEPTLPQVLIEHEQPETDTDYLPEK